MFVTGRLRQAAGLVEQLAYRDLGRGVRVGHAPPGQVALHGCVQLELAGLAKLHDRERGERLRRRAVEEERLRCHLPARVIGFSETAQVRDPVSMDDCERKTGDPLRAHLVFDVPVDGGEVGAAVRGGRRRRESDGVHPHGGCDAENQRGDKRAQRERPPVAARPAGGPLGARATRRGDLGDDNPWTARSHKLGLVLNGGGLHCCAPVQFCGCRSRDARIA